MIEPVEVRANRPTRQVLGVAARALGATLIAAAVGTILNVIQVRVAWGPVYAQPILWRALGGFLFAIPYTLAGLLLLGLPAAFMLRRFRAETTWNYSLVGAALGATWFYLWVRSPDLASWGLGAVLGCVCALSWWKLQPNP